MKNKKNTGSYYTPPFLSSFMMQYVAGKMEGRKSISILEPSVGDGSFVTSFNSTIFPSSVRKFSFTGVDRILSELRKAETKSKIKKRKATKYTFLKSDFLDFQKQVNQEFSFIVGNPPYIKKSLLAKKQIETCQEIHKSANLSSNSVKNIWSAFLVRCAQMLTNDGFLALVLPAELLQVKFSAELRSFLSINFERTEIFTFDDLLFECKGQDTILLIGFKKSEVKGQFFANIKDPKELSGNNFTLSQNAGLANTDAKWSHHLLPADDLDFIFKLGGALKNIDNYSNSKPGIVTAANDFFIVDDTIMKKYNLENYSYPIIQKGFYVNGSAEFNKRDYEFLALSGKPSKILCFKNEDVGRLPKSVIDYIKIGETLGLHNRYKCSKRENWFVVPNIASFSEGLFFKRSHHYPKLLKNSAEILVTDSAYKVDMKDGYNINDLIYSFYNSLTLAFSELYGRYYGGGVLELIPSEFKKLPIPYQSIEVSHFKKFVYDFENKIDISDVLEINDVRILTNVVGMSMEEIGRVNSIYSMLISKRLRK